MENKEETTDAIPAPAPEDGAKQIEPRSINFKVGMQISIEGILFRIHQLNPHKRQMVLRMVKKAQAGNGVRP